MFKRKQAKTETNKMRHLIAKLNPRSPISEQYRAIRTNLQFSAIDEAIKSIVITSPGPSAGKSITAANLAVVYAQQGMKTLLIDADLRKPTVHYTFRLDNLRGLSSVLIGESAFEDAVEESDVDNLQILTCGPIPPNPAELLGSKRMRELIDYVSEHYHYDFVIVDMPPILAVTDAKIVSQYVNGTLFVVRSGFTDKEELSKAYEMMNDGKARILGAVLNDVDKEDGNHYYYYGT